MQVRGDRGGQEGGGEGGYRSRESVRGNRDGKKGEEKKRKRGEKKQGLELRDSRRGCGEGGSTDSATGPDRLFPPDKV